MIFFGFILILLGRTEARAGHILFNSDGVPASEYRARLRADEDLRSPIDAYLVQRPNPRARDQLLVRFGRAQRAFLDGEVGEARRSFQDVTSLLTADDWRIEQRELLLHAYLRLAQLEPEPAARDRWLSESLGLGEDVKLNADLFPPPVTARYHELSRQIPRVRPAVEALGWPLILINGVRCASAACPRIAVTGRPARVTYLSDRWAAQVMQIDPSRLSDQSPPRLAFVTGHCGQGGLSGAAHALGDGRAFFGLNCEAPNLVPRLDVPTTTGPATTVTLPSSPTARRPLYRSPWLWAGVGAVVVTAVTLSLKNSRHANEPPPPPPPPEITTVYGY